MLDTLCYNRRVEQSVTRSGAFARVRKEYVVAGLVVVFSAVVTVLAVRYLDLLRYVGAYGYAGIIVFSFLSGSTAVVPIPGLAVTFAMGGVLNPVWVGISAGIGEAIGALTIYLAGASGRGLVQNRFPKAYPRVVGWVHRRGPAGVFLYSCVINPFFYPLTLACGALRFGVWKFFALCWAGKTVKGVALGFAGYFGLRWLVGG